MVGRTPHTRRLLIAFLLGSGLGLITLVSSEALPIVWTGRGIGAGLDGGVVAIEWWDAADKELTAWRDPGWRVGHNDFGMFGWFGWRDYPSYGVVEIPIWIPLAASVCGAAAAAFLHRRHVRRGAVGCCRGCGYDLHGLAGAATEMPVRCPECGSGGSRPGVVPA